MDVWLDERRPAVYYADESENLFPTSHSENITRQTVEEVVREAADRAELQEVYGRNADGHELHTVTLHVLRYSFAMADLVSKYPTENSRSVIYSISLPSDRS